MINRNRLICGVDLGSSWFKATAGILDKKGNLSCLRYASIKSDGINGGLITDISKSSRILKQLMRTIEKKMEHKIKSIYVSINGRDLIFKKASAVIPLCDRGNKVVRLSDINLVKSSACSLNLKLEEEIIHSQCLRFILDDHIQVENPKGLAGHKLAVDLYLVISPISHIDNIVRLVNQAGLQVEGLVFSGLAASFSTLSKEDKSRGCVLIDIGGDLTQILIFRQGILRSVDILPYGGNNITASISQILKLPIDLAQELKDSYGSIAVSAINENEEAIIKKDDLYQPIKRRAISAIIEPEVNQLFMRLKEKIDLNPSLKGIDYSITIIGGSSLLDGLLELAESILGASVRLGIPSDLSSLALQSVPYATSIGLIRYDVNSRNQNRFLPPRPKDTNLLSYLIARLKDIYNEYF